MNVSFSIDDELVIEALDQMDAKNYRASLRSGLRKSLQPLRKATLANFKKYYPDSEKMKIMTIRNYKRGIGVYFGLAKGKKSEEDVRAIIALRSLNRGRAGYISRKGPNKGNPEKGLLFWDDAVSSSEPKIKADVEKHIKASVYRRAKKLGLSYESVKM